MKSARVKDNPTVSVIIPTYNRAYLVGKAIQSVLNQTYGDFELIIVDDGSTDNTEEVVNDLKDERLQYIRHKKNKGAQVARNTGLRATRGKYVAFLDSDDEWLPEKLEKQINKFKSVSQEVGLVYSGYACVSGRTRETLFKVMPTKRGDVFRYIVERNIVGSPTVLIKKECFQKAGDFDTELLSSQDWDMWIRISKYYEFDFVPEILAKYYCHSQRISANVDHLIQGLHRMISKYQNFLSSAVVSNQLRLLGSLYFYQGDHNKASRYYRDAINKNPRNIQTYIIYLLCKIAPSLYKARLTRLIADRLEYER